MEPEINFEPFEQAQRLTSSAPWAEYSAVDSSTGRPVRLAVLWSSADLPPERTRASLDWFAEAGYQAQRLANHGLATVIAYRSTVEAAWVATEVPAGVTLRDLLREHGTLAVERAMEISSRVAATLADAHAAGWAHGFLNADSVCVDDDVVTISGLGLAIAAQAMHPEAAAYSTQRGFLSTDPRRRDMQCLGLLITEMLVGNLPDPVGVPRTDVFPPSVPAAAVKRIRSLVNLQSEDSLCAAEWAEYALVGEPEVIEAPPPPPVPDTRYYEDPARRDVSWTGIVTAAALVVLAIAVTGLWLQQWLASRQTVAKTPPAPVQAAPPVARGPVLPVASGAPTAIPQPSRPVKPVVTQAAPLAPDVLTRIWVGPIRPEDEAETEKRLRALGMGLKPWPKRDGADLYLQVDALAISANADAEAETLRRKGFSVRVVK